jgi:hypothetical protein
MAGNLREHPRTPTYLSGFYARFCRQPGSNAWRLSQAPLS